MPSKTENDAEQILSRDAFQFVFLPLRRFGVSELEAFTMSKDMPAELASVLAPDAPAPSLQEALKVIAVNPGLFRPDLWEKLPSHDRITARTAWLAARIERDTARSADVSVDEAKAELANMAKTTAVTDIEQHARVKRRTELLTVIERGT